MFLGYREVRVQKLYKYIPHISMIVTTHMCPATQRDVLQNVDPMYVFLNPRKHCAQQLLAQKCCPPAL
jgi:hypothetical protein